MDRRIFAYVDRSPFAESVWQHAVWASRQLDVPIEVIHVLDHPLAISTRDYSGHHWLDNSQGAIEERVRLDELQNRVLITEGRELLDAVAEEVRKAGVRKVYQRLFQGTLLDHLREHSESCLMAVIGKRGEGASRDAQHLGRNVERLVRSAHRPILMVSPEYAPIERAVIAWDGGASSGKSINLLANRLLLQDVPITIVHVTEHPDYLPASLEDARAHLQAAGMQVATAGVSGPVSDSILKAMRDHESDLLVIGAYGHSRIRHLVIGSTTTEILMRSETSVLVFH